ncbi:MAG: sulfatase family protein [Planctomycetota bacterium]
MRRFLAFLLLLVPAVAVASDRPNILWISCEDISPHLGCYGDPRATTPNLDQLATEGVRFTQAHHVHGVCAPARTGIITGMYPTSVGCNHMRCKGLLPEHVKPFPHYLKESGYYCTNNSKTDYNFHWNKSEVWHESSGKAHWRDRPDPDMPFFAVFNFTMCHESRVWPRNHANVVKDLPEDVLHDPAEMTLPAYYPDTPKVRESMARLYDVITAMDVAAGRILDQLEEDGLAEDTIVIFWSDHGDGLPRAKRWIYDSGTRVPMIARIPEKFRQGDYGKPRTTDDRLVSLIDLGPTSLNLAGLDVPDHMHGQPFLGSNQPEPRQYVHAARDRIDERYDMVRMVRDRRYRYMRTYMPWYPTLRRISYAERNAIRQEMRRLYAAGTLKPEAAQFLKPTRPYEELYDTQADPDEVKNLVGDPEYDDVLEGLRDECDRWMLETRDVQLLAEPFLVAADKKQGNRRSVMTGPDGTARANRLLSIAGDVASGSAERERLAECLTDADAAVRWWGAMGLGNDKRLARELARPLQDALGDECAAVRVAAARALDRAGDTDAALPVLAAALDSDNGATRLWAITVLDEMDERARPVVDSIRQAAKQRGGIELGNYVQRVAQTAMEELQQ